MTAIDPTLLALAGEGLPRAWPLPTDGWEDRLDAVFSHGLAGMLANAHGQGRVALGAPAVARLTSRLESEAIRAVQLEGELLRLETLLAEFDAVVLKGTVLAHGVYPDPSFRPFTDLDLLVDGTRHKSAVRALERFGYSRSRPEPAPRYDATVGKAHTLVHPGGVVIDLHRTLVAGLAGASIDVPAILANRMPVRIGAQTVPAPSWEAHLVEVCLHAVIGDGLERALSLRDVAQVALHPQLDPLQAAELARRWKVAGVVVEALRAAVDAFGVELPAALQAQPGGLLPPGSPPVPTARNRLGEFGHGGLRRRLTALRSAVFPSRDFLRFSYGDRPAAQLYGRRWRNLIARISGAPAPERFTEAPKQPRRSGPRLRFTPTPPGSSRAAGRAVDSLGVPEIAARARMAGVTPVRLDPAIGVPEVVALASRTAYRPVALTRAVEEERAARPDTRPATTGARSRQDRWTNARPSRLQDDPGGPARPPSPPAISPPPPPPPPPGPPGRGTEAVDGPPPNSDGRTPAAPLASGPAPKAVGPLVGGIAVLALTAIGARLGVDASGVVLVPIAALLLAWAASLHIARRRPDEDWVGRWLLLGTLVKIAASYARYLTLTIGYEGVGDSTTYDRFGRLLAQGWMGNGVAPQLDNLRETNFLKWFTGVVYYAFGPNMIAGFFVFGLLALVGSYLWYRATADAVPFLDKRLYLGLVLFAPSIAFWPSSIGKESLMQLGIGAAALGTALLLQQRLVPGIVVGAAGGWLLWVVRPHLLALVVLAAVFAYFMGRVRANKVERSSVVTRTLGLIVLAFVCVFAIGQAADFLGIKNLSVSSVETALDEQSTRNANSGSSFDNGGDYLSPVNLPRGIVTVLIRPFPWETSSPFQLLASLESVLVAGLIIVRFASVRTSLARARSTPFLLYCWVLTILYSATFASFSNFGLLVRQRSLVLPALFVLVAVRPTHETEPAPEHRGSEPAARVPGVQR